MQSGRLGSLPTLKQIQSPTVADQVFEILQQQILTLELPPRTKISEAEVSGTMGVSRQPVREAFKRLAKMGFLEILPQRSTSVSLISEEAVLRARFIRIALEVETIHQACEILTAADITALEKIIDKQRAAIESERIELFHQLDESFHREICERSNLGFVWDVILDCKAHMDRVRMLSLSSGSQHLALEEHLKIMDMLKARSPVEAGEMMTRHLDRILELISTLKEQNHDWFTSA